MLPAQEDCQKRKGPNSKKPYFQSQKVLILQVQMQAKIDMS